MPSNCFKRLEKNSFTFQLWRKSFILDDVKIADLSNNGFEWKNVTFGGSKHTMTPPTYFQGIRSPNPHDLRPRSRKCRPITTKFSTKSPNSTLLMAHVRTSTAQTTNYGCKLNLIQEQSKYGYQKLLITVQLARTMIWQFPDNHSTAALILYIKQTTWVTG